MTSHPAFLSPSTSASSLRCGIGSRIGIGTIALLASLTLACGGSHEEMDSAEGAVTTTGAEAAPDRAEPAGTTMAAPAPTAEAIEAPPEPPPAATEWDTAAWQRILSAFVTDDGGFRYAALRADEPRMADLAAAVQSVGAQDADALGAWAQPAQLAFYINAYNVLTVNSVIELWPVTSVMEEEGFFDARPHTVAGATMTLNALENDIIRARFGNPRIHFAVNCASTGCPWLDATSFTAANLDARLAALTQAFVSRTTQIDRRRRRVRTSQIFEWFAGDFEASGGVREFVAAQLSDEDAAFVRLSSTRIAHFDYDWALNGRD